MGTSLSTTILPIPVRRALRKLGHDQRVGEGNRFGSGKGCIEMAD
jgi:hypothetical protein